MFVIFKTIFGSHLYGTETEQSDIDWKGVYVPDPRDILLGRAKPSINMNDKVDDRSGLQRKNEPGETDFELYSLQKYLSLVAQGDVSALDMLFATPLIKEGKIQGDYSYVWDDLWDNRHRLASRKCESYLGYCRQQAAKYGVKGSRMDAAECAAIFFGTALEEHGDKMKVGEFSIDLDNLVTRLEHCAIVEVKQGDGRMLNAFECCNRKVMFNDTVLTAYELYQRVFDEYGHRAKAAKEKGIDWKALSHAVRVGRQAVEYLTMGSIIFPRPEALRLLDIKRGNVPYEEVAEEIEGLLVSVERDAELSSLPAEPDYQWIDDFVCRAYGGMINA